MRLDTLSVADRPFSRRRRFVNGLRNWITNPYNLMVIAAVITLLYLIVFPLLEMIVTTFRLAAVDVRRFEGAQEGSFTLYYWHKILFSDIAPKMLFKPLLNSLMIAFSVSVVSILLGSMIAWLMIRTDLPFKKFFSLAVIVPYMLPSWTKSMAWITVFKNARIGGAQGFLNFLGIQTPDWLAYGPFAIICVLSIHYFAYAYLLVSASLSSLNSELEEMGEIVGASKWRILRSITLPAVMPALLSAFILTFSKATGTFGVPAFLGLKVNYYTISTMLYSSIQQRQTGVAYAISLILIAIAAVNIFINQKAIGSRRSYATIGGKGGRSTPLSLGRARPFITAALMLFLGVAVILPLVILVVQSLMLNLGDYSLQNLTLHYWIGDGNEFIYNGNPGVLKNPAFIKALGNSLKLVLATSFLATVLGQLSGYVISRGRALRSGRLVEQLVFIPYLIPSIAFGAMYLSMFATARTVNLFGHSLTVVPALYGSFALLVLVCTVKNLPFSSRAGASNMLQISGELEEAAQIAKAGFFRRFTRIILPLSKNGFMSGFMLIFISVMKELDLVVILISPNSQTLPYLAYSYMSGGMEQPSTVVAVIMFFIVFFFYWIAGRFFHADISKSL